jgi:hypothetical protein
MEKSPSRASMAHKETVGSSNDSMPQGHVDTARWWRYKNLRALNLWILVPLLSIFSQGFVSLHPSRSSLFSATPGNKAGQPAASSFQICAGEGESTVLMLTRCLLVSNQV